MNFNFQSIFFIWLRGSHCHQWLPQFTSLASERCCKKVSFKGNLGIPGSNNFSGNPKIEHQGCIGMISIRWTRRCSAWLSRFVEGAMLRAFVVHVLASPICEVGTFGRGLKVDIFGTWFQLRLARLSWLLTICRERDRTNASAGGKCKFF